MQHVLIINPHAGKRNQTARFYATADTLRTQHGLECQCMLTSCSGGAASMARTLAASGKPVRLYACGGDGTASEVANGIAGYPNAAMTVIPSGTGNDFLKNFGPDADRFSDIESLWDGPSFPLDLIDCNGHLCLTIACSGIDAQIADGIDQFRRIPLLHGRASYLCSVAVNGLLRPLGHAWTVTLDGIPQTGKFALVSVCNGRHYGGGSTPVPEARMDDGILHTILVRAVPAMSLPVSFRPTPPDSGGNSPRIWSRSSKPGKPRFPPQPPSLPAWTGNVFTGRRPGWFCPSAG